MKLRYYKEVINPTLEKGEEKKGYFDHQRDVRISALIFGLNGVKKNLYQKFSSPKEHN